MWIWDALRIVQMAAGLAAVGLSVATWVHKIPLPRRLRFLALAGFCAVTATTAFDRFGEPPTVPYRLITDATLCVVSAIATLFYYWEPRMEPAPRAGEVDIT